MIGYDTTTWMPNEKRVIGQVFYIFNVITTTEHVLISYTLHKANNKYGSKYILQIKMVVRFVY